MKLYGSKRDHISQRGMSPRLDGAYAYRALYVARNVLLPVAWIALAVWWALWMPDPRWIASMACLALAMLLWTFVDDFHARARAQPRLVRCCAADDGVIVGGGWSFYLDKTRADGFRRVRSGRVAGTSDWWHAGTTIGDVQRALVAKGQTLASYPSVQTATLGGWLFTNAHGSGGTLWTPQFGDAVLYDRQERRRVQVPAKRFFSVHASVADQRRYDILEVQLRSVPNVWCRKEAFRLRTVDDAARFLREETHLRLAQVGGRGTLCLLWRPTEQLLRHRDPHFFSRFSMWFQADVLSAWQRRRPSDDDEWFAWPVEPRERWTSSVRLADASDFSPAPVPLFAVGALGYRNFELFVDRAPTPERLCRLCRALEPALGALRGRCEVRTGRARFFLDFSCPMATDVTPVCRAVSEVLGADAVISQHKGKAQVPLEELFGDAIGELGVAPSEA